MLLHLTTLLVGKQQRKQQCGCILRNMIILRGEGYRYRSLCYVDKMKMPARIHRISRMATRINEGITASNMKRMQQQYQYCRIQQRYKSIEAAACRSNTASVSSSSSYESDMEYEQQQQVEQIQNNETADSDNIVNTYYSQQDIYRLQHIRNVGIFAHVDAGKTTVTERMLALAGIVHRCGTVDDGNTVTDYLPAERERGITIQSAAISFPWIWHNSSNSTLSTNNNKNKNSSSKAQQYDDQVTISLIDTPGHVDFSVEVNRSVAVLDGAVLVVDSVAGVQAQTETVWRAMTRPSLNNHNINTRHDNPPNDHIMNMMTSTTTTEDMHAHEPLPCIAVINKMDKDGCHYHAAIQSMKQKLPGANPIPIQIPLFCTNSSVTTTTTTTSSNVFEKRSIIAMGENTTTTNIKDAGTNSAATNDNSTFIGVIDLVFMRAIIYPEKCNNTSVVESCIPQIVPLVKLSNTATRTDIGNDDDDLYQPIYENCCITEEAISARNELIEALAECDPIMEDIYLQGRKPTHIEVCNSIRRITLSHKGIPVLASAALRGMGVEPILDAIADFLPSPLDRQLPDLTRLGSNNNIDNKNNCSIKNGSPSSLISKSSLALEQQPINIGHPLHESLLALAFKVVHMKGRGGSGDGRIVFARVYSGEIRDKDVVQVISPPPPGESIVSEPRKERVGGMLELLGGRFDNLHHSVCYSGGVCALVGLKSVVTGDTITIASDRKSSASSASKKKRQRDDLVYLSGVSAPKPVLQVRVEAETTEQQKRLSEALQLLAIEDPSLIIEETDSSTLLSGLGELHIEIILDRIRREFGLHVMVGSPSVTYRETVTDSVSSDGLINYDRSVGSTRLQASVSLIIEPTWKNMDCVDSTCMVLADPIVTTSSDVKDFLGLDDEMSEEDLILKSDLYKSLIQGCQGALKRGIVGPHPMANVRCHILEVDAEGGLSALLALPGALRAAGANAVTTTLTNNKNCCSVLEPTMSLEITLPNHMVGPVLSDLTGCRRGCVGDVVVGGDEGYGSNTQAKALVRGDVPLVEILGYANSLRSLTGGEGAFTAEYKGHSPVQ